MNDRTTPDRERQEGYQNRIKECSVRRLHIKGTEAINLEVTQDVMDRDIRALRNYKGLPRKFKQRMYSQAHERASRPIEYNSLRMKSY